jgi:putative hemolysin
LSALADLLVVLACLFGTALCAGSETAFYRVSRVRLDMEARAGDATARRVQRLLGDPTGLVIVLILGVNLCLEIMTWRVEDALARLGLSSGAAQAVLGLVFVPAVFFCAELLPKELFRLRPHAALRFAAPIIALASAVAWPVVQALRLLAGLAARAAGGRGLGALPAGREAVLGFLRESRASGAIPAPAELMARNALKLRATPISRCMVPWAGVTRVEAAWDDAQAYARVAASQHTRLPVVGAGGACLGYVHQLDVLAAGEGVPAREHLRPIEALDPELPVDRALARLSEAGARLALVGSSAAPLGLVALKDLLEEISGELPRW